jgi:hypothetical protein
VGLALQYSMIKAYPYVVASDGANQHYTRLALAYNGSILWGVLSWLWGYLLISALVYAWYCVPHLRRLIRRQPSGGGQTHMLNGIV